MERKKKYVFNAFDYDEFYDLEKDPHEMKNLINDEEYKEDVKELCYALQKVIAETNDKTMSDAIYYMHRFLPVAPIKGEVTGDYKKYNKDF